MPANLTDNYVANTYRGVLHVNGEELPADTKVQVYDGAGNETAIKLGAGSIDCLSLSAQGLTANDFKYPDEPGNRFSVLCQTSDSAAGEVNTLELKNIQDVFCESNTGIASYSRVSESVVPIPDIECGIVRGVEDIEVTNITRAAGGIDLNQTGNFTIGNVSFSGGIVRGLTLVSAVLPVQPNLLINAQGIINQRVMLPNTGIYAEWNPRKYFLDRWKSIATNSINWLYNSSGNIVTIIAPEGGVSQTIEQINIIPGSYILSWRGTAIASIKEGATLRGSGTGGTGEVKTIAVNMTGTGNIEIRFTNGTFSLPKFERGTIRTEFDYRDVTSELILCQRYFCKTYDTTVKPESAGGRGQILSHTDEPFVGVLHSQGWSYPVIMRVGPDAWPFSSANGQINRVRATRGRSGGLDINHPCVALSPGTGRIAGLRTDTPLPTLQRIYSNHYVADAEL